FSSRRRHTRFSRDWSSDVCSSDLESLTNKVAPLHDTADPRAWANPMNERGLRVRFLPWSGSASSIQQDRLRKCSLATLRSPITLASGNATTATSRTTANASKLRQGTHALEVDGKLLAELLGRVVLFGVHWPLALRSKVKCHVSNDQREQN